MSPTYGASEFPEDLKNQILSIIYDRLNTGEVLLSESQFVAAMEEGFQTVSRATLDEATKAKLVEIVRKVNEDSPEILVVPGLENWVIKSVLASVQKQGFGVIRVQEGGYQMVRDFVHSPKVQGLISRLDIQARQLNLRRCFRTILNQVAGKVDVDQKRSAARLAQLKEGAASQPPAADDAGTGDLRRVSGGLDRLLDGPAQMPTEEEAQIRTAEQEKAQSAIREAQVANLVNNIDSYVEQGMLDADDAALIRKAHKVDEAVRLGKVNAEQGSKIRNSILSGNVRDKIEKSVSKAVDFCVQHLQVFDTLKRIESRFDGGLRFLIRHKDAVNADRDKDAPKPAELGLFVKDLLGDMDVLEQVIDLMDRKDAEIRMIDARLPPYDGVMRGDQSRIEGMVVDETFMDLLRAEDGSESTAERLNCADKGIRDRAAADIQCMTNILNRLIRPTPARKEIRLLKINLIVEEFYRDEADLEQAGIRAQEFVKTQIRNMYPDLSEEENQEIQERGAQIIEAVEQKIVAERKEQEAAEAAASGDGEEEDETLSEEEEQMGVQVHRIPVRVAGHIHNIPFKVMPDADDTSKFIIVQKDPKSGEMVPVRRRGQKRFVQRSRHGWELA